VTELLCEETPQGVRMCGYGGYCARRANHAGAHTASPPRATVRWDRRVEDAVALLLLDWPSPPWADLLDW